MQRRLGAEIPVDHPIMAWLVGHTCLVINAIFRGEDGRIAWARARGRPFRQRLIGFAESCLYTLLLEVPQQDAEGNMAPRWKIGTFLGYNHEANPYVLWKEEGGIATSRAVLRRPMADCWKIREVEEIVASPWDVPQKGIQEVTFKPHTEKLGEFPGKVIGVPRRFKITNRDLENVGYTSGCPQCAHILRSRAARGGMQHSDRCSTRVMAEVSKTPIRQGSGRRRRGEDDSSTG